MSINVKETFERFNTANYFSRVDNHHILELHIGLDDKGQKAIELRAPFVPRKVSGTAAIEVNQFTKPEYNTIRFSLCDKEISGLFYMFCDDLIEETRNLTSRDEGYTAIVNRFFQWKKMFVSANGTLLTEPEIMGMIGEILYLKRYLIPRLGPYEALKSWSGQELTHKDFSYDNTWTEVKSVKSGAQSVKISSLEQLDSDEPGTLAVFMLEKMSMAYHGITLNKLIVETRNLFTSGEDRDSFMSKVAVQGYEYKNYYDEYVYEISGFKEYRVSDDFPRLTANDVASAIKKATYDLSLTDLAPYEIDK